MGHLAAGNDCSLGVLNNLGRCQRRGLCGGREGVHGGGLSSWTASCELRRKGVEGVLHGAAAASKRRQLAGGVGFEAARSRLRPRRVVRYPGRDFGETKLDVGLDLHEANGQVGWSAPLADLPPHGPDLLENATGNLQTLPAEMLPKDPKSTVPRNEKACLCGSVVVDDELVVSDQPRQSIRVQRSLHVTIIFPPLALRTWVD